MKHFTVLPLSYLDREKKPYESAPVIYCGRSLSSARKLADACASPCGIVYPDGSIERRER